MSAAPRFPYRVSPWPDESGLGYIARLAEHNGYTGLPWLWQMFGEETLAELATNSRHVPALAAATDETISAIEQVCYLADGTSYRFGAIVADRADLRLSSPRVCGACLAEAPYRRRVWDHAAYVSCPKHSQVLVNRCGICRGLIGWQRVDRCHHCGINFADVQHIPAGARLGAHREIEARVAGGTTLSPSFALSDLSSLLQILNELGGTVLEGLADSPIERRYRKAMFKNIDEGFEAIGHGREGFRAFLLRTTVPDAAGRSDFPSFPELIRVLAGLRQHREYTILADWFADIVHSEPTLHLRVSRVSTERRLGIATEESHGEMLAAALLRSSSQEPERMTLADMATRLWISRGRVVSLVEAGLLPVNANRDEFLADFWSFSRIASDELWSRLVRHAPRNAEQFPADSANFTRCFPGARCCHSQFVQVVHALIDGSLRPIGIEPSNRGFNRLIFSRADVAMYLATMKIDDDRRYSIDDAAGMLGTNLRAFCRIAAARLLPAIVEVRNGRRCVEVTGRALARFRSTYVFSHELAARLPTASIAAIDHLQAYGLREVRAPSFTRRGPWLYHRHHLNAPLPGRLGSSARGDKALHDAVRDLATLRARQLLDELGDSDAAQIDVAAAARRNGTLEFARAVLDAIYQLRHDGAKVSIVTHLRRASERSLGSSRP